MIGIILGGLLLFFYFEQNSLSTTTYRLKTDKLKREDGPLRIVQLSDLHAKSFGSKNGRLVKKIKKLNPDLIFATGDLVSSTDLHGTPFLDIVDGLKGQYPIFYIEGNHETTAKYDQLTHSTPWYDEYVKQLTDKGVIMLDNTFQSVRFGREKIVIYGLPIPLTHYEAVPQSIKDCAHHQEMTDLAHVFPILDPSSVNILLAHSPFLAPLYEKHGFDYVYSGHVHGGVLRLPFVGGLLSPERKFFPTYSSGVYSIGQMKLIVSRGLGRLRLFNRPHLVVVDMTSNQILKKPRRC